MTEYRKATAADYAAIIDFSNDVFTRKYDKDGNAVYDRTYFQNILPKLYQNPATAPCHSLALEDGAIAACVASFPLDFSVLGETLRCCGVGTVGVRAESRGHGHMIRLLGDAVTAAQAEGYDFMLLSGQRQRYEHFGFAQAGVDPNFTLTATNFRHAFGKDASFGYTFRPVTAGDDAVLDAIDALHRAQPHAVVRDRALLYATLQTFYATPYAVFDRDGSFAGSLMHRPVWQSVCDVKLTDGSRGAEVLCDFMRQKRLRRLAVHRPALHETALVASLSGVAEEMSAGHCEMIRIFHYAPVLRAYLVLKASYTPLPDGAVTLGFASGEVLRLAVRDNRVSVTPADEQPLLTLDDKTAVNLLFGPFSHLTDFGIALPAAVRAWLPLPFHLDAADAV